MAAITNLGSLKTAVSQWMNRDDLSSVIPQFIQFAEKQIKQKLRIREMIKYTSVTISDGTAVPSSGWPTDFVEVIQAQLGNTTRDLLQYLSPAALLAFDDGSSGGQGTPKYFSILQNSGAEQFTIRPAADTTTVSGNGTIELTYYAFSDLSSDSDTNIILDKHPEIYLYHALSNSSSYLVDDQRVALWTSLAQSAMTELLAESAATFYAGRRNVRFSQPPTAG